MRRRIHDDKDPRTSGTRLQADEEAGRGSTGATSEEEEESSGDDEDGDEDFGFVTESVVHRSRDTTTHNSAASLGDRQLGHSAIRASHSSGVCPGHEARREARPAPHIPAGAGDSSATPAAVDSEDDEIVDDLDDCLDAGHSGGDTPPVGTYTDYDDRTNHVPRSVGAGSGAGAGAGALDSYRQQSRALSDSVAQRVASDQKRDEAKAQEAQEADEDGEDEYVYLRLQPGDNSWGLGASYANQLGPPAAQEEEDDGVDKTFCPVCVLGIGPSIGDMGAELFQRMARYGTMDHEQFAKDISNFYRANIQYSLITDPAMQKDWHWRCVLIHMRNHSGNASVFAKDQIHVVDQLITVSAANTVRVKKRRLNTMLEECKDPAQLDNQLMMEASLEQGSIRNLKDLITLRKQLMVQYDTSHKLEMDAIHRAQLQRESTERALVTASRNRRQATTHANELYKFLQSK